MDLFDAIYARRSVRQFTDEPVSREDLKKITATAIEAPTGCNAQFKHYVIIDDPAVMDAIRPSSGVFKTACAAVAIVMEPKAAKFGEFWMQDASAAMQNMLLAAEALGYGACWVEGALRPHEDALREALGVGEDMLVWSIMAIGHSAVKASRPPKPQFEEVAFFNRLGSKE